MLPYLTVLSIKIPTYGLLIMLGAAIGVTFAVYVSKHAGITRDDIFNAACFAGIGAFVGAKLLYLALTLPPLLAQGAQLNGALLYELFAYGFVFYGGAIGGIGAVYIYARKYKLPFLPLMETLIPSVPLIHAFGRLGCFCAGCCYGIVAQPPWGVYFHASQIAPHTIPLLPIQLYEASFNILLFLCLGVYARKNTKAGRVLGLYLTAYAIARFVLEFFRFDAVRGIFLGVSTSQWISLPLLIAGLYLLIRKVPEHHTVLQANSGTKEQCN